MTHEIELKPCPFCGSGAHLREKTYPNGEKGWLLSSFPGCAVCDAIGGIEHDEAERFAEDWNRRWMEP